PAVVDEFMKRLDSLLAGLARKPPERGWFGIDQDYDRLAGADARRCFAVRFGPLKFRLFWARIGNGLYVASKAFILDDLRAASTAASPEGRGASGPIAHAMIRIRAENWN